MLLASRGYTVTSAEGYTDALRKCRASSYDLLIIGHSIPRDDKRAIVDEMRQHCSAPVLALLRTNEPELTSANQSIDASRPDLLVAAVESLIQRKRPVETAMAG